MRYVSAIVLAAGKSLRLKSRITKPLIEINSQPIIIYSLKRLNQHPRIKEIIVVVNQSNRKDIADTIRKYKIGKVRKVVLGGRLRQDSVRLGLKAIGLRSDLVLIHDAARPFIHQQAIDAVIKQADQCAAAIVGVPVKATIKEVTGRLSQVTKTVIVKKTLKRDNLFEVQTPQVFQKDLILKAYQRFGNIEVTDDAMLVEKLGAKVAVVPGSYDNIKITTPEDLILAEAIAKN